VPFVWKAARLCLCVLEDSSSLWAHARHFATNVLTCLCACVWVCVHLQYVDAAAAEEQQALPEDPQERRRHLKMADAARRQAEEELQYEEVPQPDEDADGI